MALHWEAQVHPIQHLVKYNTAGRISIQLGLRLEELILPSFG